VTEIRQDTYKIVENIYLHTGKVQHSVHTL